MGTKSPSLITGAIGIPLLIGCATAYGPMGPTGGYSDLQLNERAFEVRFQGNGFTPADIVQDYIVRRCAELTIDNGYSHFVFVDRSASGETFSSVMNLPTSTSVTGSVLGNTFHARAYTTGGPVPFTITKHRAHAHIYLLTEEEVATLEPRFTALAVDAGLVLQQMLGLPIRRFRPPSVGQAADPSQPQPVSAGALPVHWKNTATGKQWSLKRKGDALFLAADWSTHEVERGEYAGCKFEGTELPLSGTCREVQFRRCAHRRTRCEFESRARIRSLQPTRIEGETELPHMFDCGRCRLSEFPGSAWSLIPGP